MVSEAEWMRCDWKDGCDGKSECIGVANEVGDGFVNCIYLLCIAS